MKKEPGSPIKIKEVSNLFVTPPERVHRGGAQRRGRPSGSIGSRCYDVSRREDRATLGPPKGCSACTPAVVCSTLRREEGGAGACGGGRWESRADARAGDQPTTIAWDDHQDASSTFVESTNVDDASFRNGHHAAATTTTTTTLFPSRLGRTLPRRTSRMSLGGPRTNGCGVSG